MYALTQRYTNVINLTQCSANPSNWLPTLVQRKHADWVLQCMVQMLHLTHISRLNDQNILGEPGKYGIRRRRLQSQSPDLIRGIIDPEKPQTLEELDVVSEDNVHVSRLGQEEYLIKIVFVPTVPHCSLASLIGLCMRSKLEKNMPEKFKLDIFIKEGTHSTAEEINKQINDKERVAAAMENPNLQRLIDKCIEEEY